jgi:hypothetical protein
MHISDILQSRGLQLSIKIKLEKFPTGRATDLWCWDGAGRPVTHGLSNPPLLKSSAVSMEQGSFYTYFKQIFDILKRNIIILE